MLNPANPVSRMRYSGDDSPVHRSPSSVRVKYKYHMVNYCRAPGTALSPVPKDRRNSLVEAADALKGAAAGPVSGKDLRREHRVICLDNSQVGFHLQERSGLETPRFGGVLFRDTRAHVYNTLIFFGHFVEVPQMRRRKLGLPGENEH